MGDGFCDLAHLLTAYGQISHFFCGINLDVQTIKKLFCFLIHLRIVDEFSIHDLTADENVLGHGQMVHHI